MAGGLGVSKFDRGKMAALKLSYGWSVDDVNTVGPLIGAVRMSAVHVGLTSNEITLVSSTSCPKRPVSGVSRTRLAPKPFRSDITFTFVGVVLLSTLRTSGSNPALARLPAS